MALGSSAYPDFCMAGKTMDILWQRLGGTPLAKIKLGNELEGQAKSVRDWQVWQTCKWKRHVFIAAMGSLKVRSTRGLPTACLLTCVQRTALETLQEFCTPFPTSWEGSKYWFSRNGIHMFFLLFLWRSALSLYIFLFCSHSLFYELCCRFCSWFHVIFYIWYYTCLIRGNSLLLFFAF